MSVMWSRPSTPPRSMKAPKSVMFLTTPLRTWPTCSSFMRTSRLVLRSASSSTRRLTTMLRRRLLSLMILNSKLCPSSSSMLGTRRSAIWLPGRNASTPIRSTTTPPLIFLTRVPETASSFSYASRIRSHTRMKSAFFFERTTAPSWSSRCSRKTSTSSPSLSEWGSLNSSIGTAPSDLKPTSRMTAASVTRSTLDLTISPSSMLERVPSYSSVIFAISSDEYSSCRSERTRRWEWVGAGVSDFDSGRSSVSTSIQYTGSVAGLDRARRNEPRGLEYKTPNLAGELLTRQRQDLPHLLFQVDPSCIQEERVGGWLHWGHRPGGVGVVAGSQRLGFAAQLVRIDSPAALGQAAPGPLSGTGRQEYFDRSVRKDHGPDVATIDDHAAGVSEHRFALLHLHPVPYLPDRRNLRNAPRDPVGPDRLLDVHPGHLGPKDVPDEHQPHGQFFRERDDLLNRPRGTAPRDRQGLLEGLPLPEIVEHRERHCSIERAGVEVRPAEAPSHQRRRGALSGGGRAIDRDHARPHRLPFLPLPLPLPSPFPPAPMRRKSANKAG